VNRVALGIRLVERNASIAAGKAGRRNDGGGGAGAQLSE
jgi:hypothetical protein